MHCVVTAGPTYEPLDRVRRLTNFSTGRLGLELAEYLRQHGHTVSLLLGEMATADQNLYPGAPLRFTTTSDLREKVLAQSSEKVDAVFHAAAVSDFRPAGILVRNASGDFEEVRAGKVSSASTALFVELERTPKIIDELRDHFPQAWLIGWKYEVDGSKQGVLELAREQITRARTDVCIANGPAYGEGFGFVTLDGNTEHLADRSRLYERLEGLLHQQKSA